MQEPTTAVAVKAGATAATAAAAAFGLTGWAVAAALAGSAAALHLEKEAPPSTIWKVLAAITAQGFLAAMLAAALPLLPGFGWTTEIPVAVRAGLLGVLAKPAYLLLAFLVDKARAFFGAKLGG